jgi:hypothetical protein
MITSIRDSLDRIISEYFHLHGDYVDAWKNNSKMLVAESFATWFKTLNHNRHINYTLGRNPETPIAERFDLIFENSLITTDCERFSLKYGVVIVCDRRARDNGISNYDVLIYLRSTLEMDFVELRNERALYETMYQERLRRIQN